MAFPSRYANWVRECITTPMYLVAVNGGLAGFFSRCQVDETKGSIDPLFVFASNGTPKSDA